MRTIPCPRGTRRARGTDGKQDFRLLGFREGVAGWWKIDRPIQAEAMAQPIGRHEYRHDFPTQQRSSIGQRAYRVAHIKLTVAEGAFAIFPGFTPHDAGQSNGEPCTVLPWAGQRPSFENMVFRIVVLQALTNSGQTSAQYVGFDRMQVARGRITAQCPAIRPPAFPGRYPEGEFEQRAETVQVGKNFIFGLFSS
jgi:hypothetical protein